jgi:hypothetical protein
MSVVSKNTWNQITDLEGHRWTTKTFTKPFGVPLYQHTPAGADIKAWTDKARVDGILWNKVNITTLPEGREQYVIQSCWTDSDRYHEFEIWYKENAMNRVKQYELENSITHEYNVQALDSNTTVDDFTKESFINKFSFRRNITFFDQEKIPEKAVIEKILQDAYKYVPILQCVYPFRVKIWGPEYTNLKKQLVLRTVCGPNQHNFHKGGKHEGDWKKCEEIYDGWIKQCSELKRDSLYEGCYFNQQIVAPYLISWHPVPIAPTQSQLDQGYVERRANNVELNLVTSIIGASMHGYGMSLLSANEGLFGSFTKRFITNVDTAENLPEPIKPMYTQNLTFGTVPFVLGIGYQDTSIPYEGDANKGIKPSFDELHFWQ